MSTDATGKIDGTDSFDGTDDMINTTMTTLATDTSFTVSAWMYTSSSTGQMRVIAKDRVGERGQFLFWTNAGQLELKVCDALTNDWGLAGTSVPTTDTWHHVVGIWDQPNQLINLYIDGSLADSSSVTWANTNTNSLPVTIGAASYGQNHWAGLLDEIRLSTIPRSPCFVEVSYTNQNDPTSFITVGTQETN
jgi:hypothetical protein